jgi:hypothetical protein
VVTTVNNQLKMWREQNIWGGMAINATFNNIYAISWRSVLLVEETGVPGENHRPAESNWQTLSRNVVARTRDSNSQRYWW